MGNHDPYSDNTSLDSHPMCDTRAEEARSMPPLAKFLIKAEGTDRFPRGCLFFETLFWSCHRAVFRMPNVADAIGAATVEDLSSEMQSLSASCPGKHARPAHILDCQSSVERKRGFRRSEVDTFRPRDQVLKELIARSDHRDYLKGVRKGDLYSARRHAAWRGAALPISGPRTPFLCAYWTCVTPANHRYRVPTGAVSKHVQVGPKASCGLVFERVRLCLNSWHKSGQEQ